MASVTNNAVGKAGGNGLGPKTFVFAITIADITVANAIATATADYGLTVTAVEGVANGNHIACQGANIHHTDGDGLESETGVALVATFDQNPA